MSALASEGPAARAVAEMARLGGLLRPAAAEDIPPGEYVYLVSNGENVLQLGKGDQIRVRKCTRGGLAGKHNKAFICAVGELVLGRPNSYVLLRVPSKDHADAIEEQLHRHLGIVRNRDGATLIAGINERSIIGIHQALWARAKVTDSYRALEPVEQQMAEEMFELVTYATSRVLRSSGKVVSSVQADNLEGNILMNLGRQYLTNVFMRLTRQYLRYGPTHRLTDAQFAERKRKYAYTPKGASFVVSNHDSVPA